MIPLGASVAPVRMRSTARACAGPVALRNWLAWVRVMAVCTILVTPAPGRAENATPRYLDVTARRDGWAVAQALAVSGSKDKAVVVVSYANPQTTRAFLGLVQRYAAAPHSLPIFGVVRAPRHPETANRLDYTVFFNGTPIPTEAEPDRRFTPLEHLDASLRSVGRVHFGWPQVRP